MVRIGSTPSFSIFVSFIHESYKLRALITAFGSVSEDEGVDKRSK
jgi:hypothetical protein